MKTILYALAILFAASTALTGSAQINKNSFKTRQETMKLNKKLQNEKVSKASKQRAKEDKKDGWKASGGLTLEQQYERATVYMNSFEDDGVTPIWVFGEGQSIGAVYDGAKRAALTMARTNIIGSIEADITEIADNSVSNNQLSSEDAVTLAKTVTASKSMMSKRLGQTVVAIERYRKLRNGKYEVYVQIFYNMNTAREIVKSTLRAELEKENKELSEKLENDILGW